MVLTNAETDRFIADITADVDEVERRVSAMHERTDKVVADGKQCNINYLVGDSLALFKRWDALRERM